MSLSNTDYKVWNVSQMVLRQYIINLMVLSSKKQKNKNITKIKTLIGVLVPFDLLILEIGKNNIKLLAYYHFCKEHKKIIKTV